MEKLLLAHVPPSPSWSYDMRVSLMGILILQFARSVQDATHKKLQPLDSLMLGDSRDRLRDCGREKAGARSFVNSQVLCSHMEISSLYLPWHHLFAIRWIKDSLLSLAHCRRTFKHLTIQMILIS